jgi:hypothetical protein
LGYEPHGKYASDSNPLPYPVLTMTELLPLVEKAAAAQRRKEKFSKPRHFKEYL